MKNKSMRWLIFAVMLISLSAASFAQISIGISVRFGPPALPVYAQPICPGPGYMWTPGYWAWNDEGGYYWVPGTWVLAPVGMLWTPGYWGWGGGLYAWHAGYWGPHIGFYGGVNYGFGYTGAGFWGGEWRGGHFFYNRSVTNINVTNVTNVYEHNVVVNNTSRVSFNGGEGGIVARPTAEEERFAREPHTAPLAAQTRQERMASENRTSFASENHGRPTIAATGRAGEFSGHSVVGAREAGEPYRAPKMSPQEARGPSNENRASENRMNENRAAESRASENREQQRNERNRETARTENREASRQENRENARQAQQNRNEQRHEQQQAKQEAKQEQKHQQQEKVQHKQEQQHQKQQRQEAKRERGTGR